MGPLLGFRLGNPALVILGAPFGYPLGCSIGMVMVTTVVSPLGGSIGMFLVLILELFQNQMGQFN